MSRPFLVGIGGTTRPESSGERLVRAVLRAAEARGATTRLFAGQQLKGLPHFAPESDVRTHEQLDLLSAVRKSDGLVICSPGYHGGVSALVKNALDLLEDLRDDSRCYVDGRAVALIVVAAGCQACGTTLSALRDIVHALRGWPTPIGLTVNSLEQRPFGPDGEIADGSLQDLIERQAEQLLHFVKTVQGASSPAIAARRTPRH